MRLKNCFELQILIVGMLLLATFVDAQATVSFSPRADFTVLAASNSVAMADFNMDGKPDIVTNGIGNGGSPGISVLLNTTAPGALAATFSAMTDIYAAPRNNNRVTGIAVGDLNADGKPDCAVSGTYSSQFRSIVWLFVNTTPPGASIASFESYQFLLFFIHVNLVSSIVIKDIDGDDLPDISVSNFEATDVVPWDVVVYINNTAAGDSVLSFGQQNGFGTGAGPRSVSSGDFNGDGLEDLFTANEDGSSASVLLNSGLPSNSNLFHNNVDFATGGDPWSGAIGDIDGDGKPDLVTGSSAGLSVLLNRTALADTVPLFTAPTDFSLPPNNLVEGLVIDDFNADGKSDMVAVSQALFKVSVFSNTTPTGSSIPTMAARMEYDTAFFPIGVTSGDLNGDGQPDLAVVSGVLPTVSVLLNTSSVSGVGDEVELSPARPTMEQNYPNPFNPSTTIRYELANRSQVDLSIYNVAGQKVATVVTESQDQGWHVARWNGMNDLGQAVSSGVYTYVLRAGDETVTKNLVLLK